MFDRYFLFSIKDCERENHNEEDYVYSITGAAQTRPIDFAKCLRNRKFKRAFVEFLAEHWKSEIVVSILNEKKGFFDRTRALPLISLR